MDDYESDIEREAVKLISIDELKLNKDENILLVLGSEGEGVSRTISKLSNYRIIIPPQMRMD